MVWSQEKYRKAIDFAARAHLHQGFPGKEYNYLVHVCLVAMEIMQVALIDKEYDYDFAISCALLHDTIEDTEVSYEDIEKVFGKAIADGVLALSKNQHLPKEEQMLDSLKRIKGQPPEIAMVKLADRITNLDQPPRHWSQEKIRNYRDQAIVIYDSFKHIKTSLLQRLKEKIEIYSKNHVK